MGNVYIQSFSFPSLQVSWNNMIWKIVYQSIRMLIPKTNAGNFESKHCRDLLLVINEQKHPADGFNIPKLSDALNLQSNLLSYLIWVITYPTFQGFLLLFLWCGWTLICKPKGLVTVEARMIVCGKIQKLSLPQHYVLFNEFIKHFIVT